MLLNHTNQVVAVGALPHGLRRVVKSFFQQTTVHVWEQVMDVAQR